MIVLVIISVPTMFEIICQRKQETCAIAAVTCAIPLYWRVTTDQSLIRRTLVQRDHRYRCTSAIATAMEG
jgi:hypothetical protein